MNIWFTISVNIQINIPPGATNGYDMTEQRDDTLSYFPAMLANSYTESLSLWEEKN